ncbi:hypothetical protein CDL15_Pgr025222 [Punica granatum]|uniref:Uncharacterized protein n=1 Tax=Punica granatum TaxID=22663 RepID=A0A218W8B3_PUNGR|nr:hypothetical protein CDL15_Pgr025222 [Punica granatum]PKI73372.1 hypothetical protein CRG98_006310 [Punica granatum]
MSPPAKKSLSAVAVEVVLLFLLLAAACRCCAARASGRFFHAASPGTRNREGTQVGAVQHGAETAAAAATARAGISGEEFFVVKKRLKLREVPLGPDPLHHHGSSPRKPRITPP